MRTVEPLTDFLRQRTNSASSAQVETPQLELFSSQCSVAEPVENITGTPEATLHVSIAWTIVITDSKFLRLPNWTQEPSLFADAHNVDDATSRIVSTHMHPTLPPTRGELDG